MPFLDAPDPADPLRRIPTCPDCAAGKPKLPRPITNPIFTAAENDVGLRSSNGQVFGFQAKYLEAASDFWDGLFRLGTPAAGDGGAGKKRERPVIDVAESSFVLEQLLLFIHPRAGDPKLVSYLEVQKCVPFLLSPRARLEP